MPRTTLMIDPEDREEATIAATRGRRGGQLRLHPAEPSWAADRVRWFIPDRDCDRRGHAGRGRPRCRHDVLRLRSLVERRQADLLRCHADGSGGQERRVYSKVMKLDNGAAFRSRIWVSVTPRLLRRMAARWRSCSTAVAFPGVQGGVWLMRSDGSQRRRVGGFGRPKWSPDGRQFLLTDFAIPAHARLLDVSTRNIATVQLKELEFWSAPNWVSPDLVVAVVGRGWGYTIALIDVTDPAHSKVKEVLWEMNFKGPGDRRQSAWCGVCSRCRTAACSLVAQGGGWRSVPSCEASPDRRGVLGAWALTRCSRTWPCRQTGATHFLPATVPACGSAAAAPRPNNGELDSKPGR